MLGALHSTPYPLSPHRRTTSFSLPLFSFLPFPLLFPSEPASLPLSLLFSFYDFYAREKKTDSPCSFFPSFLLKQRRRKKPSYLDEELDASVEKRRKKTQKSLSSSAVFLLLLKLLCSEKELMLFLRLLLLEIFVQKIRHSEGKTKCEQKTFDLLLLHEGESKILGFPKKEKKGPKICPFTLNSEISNKTLLLRYGT